MSPEEKIETRERERIEYNEGYNAALRWARDALRWVVAVLVVVCVACALVSAAIFIIIT
jgi:hypothetical protein